MNKEGRKEPIYNVVELESSLNVLTTLSMKCHHQNLGQLAEAGFEVLPGRSHYKGHNVPECGSNGRKDSLINSVRSISLLLLQV